MERGMARQEAEIHLGRVLDSLAGPGATPRPDQVDAVAATLSPVARVLVVQATGWGKSAVYWAATSAMREAGRGPTLVVSPLLALMRNQVAAAQRAGLRAATINSSNIDDWDEIYEQLQHDHLDVLLISPERLGNAKFASQLEDLLARIGLVVIDEAHCISDWGFDFRPDYQRLARTLLSTPSASVLATTATANQRVTKDVSDQMGANSVVFRGTLARSSLSLSVVPGMDPVERFAWVANTLGDISGSGIIYVLTVAEANRLAGFLQEAGFDCKAYTGALSTEERAVIEQELLDNRIKGVVATSALGMGYDKPDLAFCIHVGSPSSPVSYYQQVGRAGRGLDNAIAVLLPSEADERIWEFFATASIPDPANVDLVLEQLALRDQSIPELESTTGLRRGRLESLLKVLGVDGYVVKVGSKWSSLGRPYEHDVEKWTALKAVREQEAELMRSFASGSGCLMKFLQTALDDPSPSSCGRCSVCTGVAPGPGTRPSRDWIRLARDFSRGVDVIIEPRKRWPSGSSHKGSIRGLGEGRAVAYADDPGWTPELAAMISSGFREIPESLLEGAIEALKRWSQTWPERPTWVLAVPGPGAMGEANRKVAQHIAQIGNRPLLEPFEWKGDPVPTEAASLLTTELLDERIQLLPGLEIPEGPVLACSAVIQTRWTAATIARHIEAAGGGTVLPFAIHQRP